MHRAVIAALVLGVLTVPGLAGDCDYPTADTMFPLGRPSAGSVAREFGLQYDDKLKKKTEHTGVDFEAAVGDPVYAARGGKVSEVGQDGSRGKYLRIDHEGGVETGYGNLSATSLQPGDCVTPGQEIGKAGLTGHAPGPQLHFEVWRDGKAVDPLQLLPD
jgi:murein DD-endopeptidase MepM/ murein hydrolase activator NlpD